MANGDNGASQIEKRQSPGSTPSCSAATFISMAPSVVTTPSQHTTTLKEDFALSKGSARDGSPRKAEKKEAQQFSFEDQLTFSPKLNPLSLKLAEGKRTSVAERFTTNKYERYDSQDSVFTFKPVISSSSCKIIAKLKTDFWQRQKMHVERQRQAVSAIFLPCFFIQRF